MIREKDIIYLSDLSSSSISFPEILEVKKLGLADDIPIVSDEVGRFLYFTAKLLNPMKVLELGLGGGYSTIWIKKALSDNALFTSVELNKDRIDRVRPILKGVDIRCRDALSFLEGSNDGECDFIFLDAIKSSYLRYLELIPRVLKSGGIFIADNILFRGFVNDAFVEKKYRNGVNVVRKFNKALSSSPFFETMFLGIGDGLSLSIRV